MIFKIVGSWNPIFYQIFQLWIFCVCVQFNQIPHENKEKQHIDKEAYLSAIYYDRVKVVDERKCSLRSTPFGLLYYFIPHINSLYWSNGVERRK